MAKITGANGRGPSPGFVADNRLKLFPPELAPAVIPR